MVIAIDFDGTLTADPPLWSEFIRQAREREHLVLLVTARRETEENYETIDRVLDQHDCQIPVYFSNLGSKMELMERRGIKVDIWIDDDPRVLVRGF